MAPPFLTGNVYYQQDVGVVDVTTIINDTIAKALAAVPAWTNPSAGKIVSPMDADGRQVSIQFNRISATNLEMVSTDGQGRSATRRAQIAAGGSTVNIYIGQFHMILDWLNSSTPEGLATIMLDESPEVQTSHNMWMVVLGKRTAADAIDGGWVFGAALIVRNANTFVLSSLGILCPIYNDTSNGNTSGGQSRTQGGSNIWWPIIQMGDFPNANVFNITGKYYQCLAAKDTFNPPDSEVSVPIDQTNTAIFRVLQQPTWVPSGSYSDRMAVRKT
jgi:hypothetical protein